MEFGTGGLRGIIGDGNDRMNVDTVRRATQGFAAYLLTQGGGSAAISYDSRHKSDEFARATVEVFAGNGVTAYLYPTLMPTPMLSFAVRHLHCAWGVMITASHNPAQYNGYKAYGPDGCQLGLEESLSVTELINQVNSATEVKRVPFDDAMRDGRVRYINASLAYMFKSSSALGSRAPMQCGIWLR